MFEEGEEEMEEELVMEIEQPRMRTSSPHQDASSNQDGSSAGGSSFRHYPSSSGEDLDVQDQLYGTTQSLMEALYDEQKARVALERKMVSMQDDFLEKMTAKELEIDEAR